MNNFTSNQLFIAILVGIAVVFYLVKGFLAKRKVSAALADGAFVIDVRSASEFQGGHFSGAVNIPHDRIGTNMKKIGPTDRNIVLYCASGSRSSAAAAFLRTKGYTRVTNAGGIASMPR